MPTKTTSINFQSAIKICFNKYAEFSGSASRPEYWWFTLFTIISVLALASLDVATPDGTIGIGVSLASFWLIVTLLPSFAVTVRRLRDSNHAWTNLFWLLVPIGGMIILTIYLCEPTNGRK